MSDKNKVKALESELQQARMYQFYGTGAVPAPPPIGFGPTVAASGFRGKLIFDLMAWFGDGNTHRVTRYSSQTPAVIAAQLTLMKAAGAAGVRVTWQGPSSTFIHNAAIAICNQRVSLGMLFSLIISPQVNGQANWWLNSGFLGMCNSPAYIPEKYLCDFSTGINYAGVTLPAGFSVLTNQHGFNWINPQTPAVNATALAELRTVNALGTMKWPFLCMSFFDGGFPSGSPPSPTRDYNKQVWDAANSYRIVEQEAGNFFHDSVAALSLCPSAPYVGMVWNDAEEHLVTVEGFMSAFYGLRVGA